MSKGSFAEIDKMSDWSICRDQAFVATMNELVSSRRAASGLVQMGKLSFVYSPKDPTKAYAWQNAIATIAGNMVSSANADRDAEALLNLLILDVVYNGALDAQGSGFELNPEEREYLFYAISPKKITKQKK